jgi:hypothetical protein
LKIVIPPRAGHFSTLHLPAKAAKTKLALRAQTVVFAGAEAAGAGRPEKSPMRASGIRFPNYAKVSLYHYCTPRIAYVNIFYFVFFRLTLCFMDVRMNPMMFFCSCLWRSLVHFIGKLGGFNHE